VASKFGRLLHSLGLSPERAARITASIVRHEEAYAALVGRMDKLSPGERDDPANATVISVKAALAEENARQKSELEALLGSSGYSEFERFQRTASHWNQVADLAANLYTTSTPLTPAQADRLGQILIASATTADGRIRRTISNWDAIMAQAAVVLSPPQLETWDASRKHNELWTQLGRMRNTTVRNR